MDVSAIAGDCLFGGACGLFIVIWETGNLLLVICLEICAICCVAMIQPVGEIKKMEKSFGYHYLSLFRAVNCGF